MEKTIFIFLASLILFSCSDKVSQLELSGAYNWNNSQKGNLIINSDLTYIYEFDLGVHDTTRNIGTWEFDSTKQEVHFHDFRFSERDTQKGIWISRVRIRNNEIQLVYASDSDIYLRRIE